MNFLEMEKISKSFGAINALQGVDFFIKPGEAVGLMVIMVPVSLH